ncbi:MAG TPA: hypothetical protein DCP31_03920, partial [Cyanobacteria bacterium UBA8543]|nr:hypothetical protein [Cyanobacteria bacterium UBA8543]
QQIQQLQGEFSELKQQFNQRKDSGEIEEVKQLAAAIQQQIFALEPVPPAFDPTPLEQQIQQLKLAIAQIDSTQTNFTIELAKVPQLWENIAHIQHQQSELQQLILQIKQPPRSPVFPLVTFGGKIQPHRTKNKRIEAIMAMAEAQGIGEEFQMV